MCFKGLTMTGQGCYSGIIKTSWWGNRPVKLLNYTTLSPKQKREYPDLVTDLYYQSRPRLSQTKNR